MLRAWKDLSPDALREARIQYRKEHPENPDRKKKTAVAYYETNKAQKKEMSKNWVAKNPEKLFRAQLLRLYDLTFERWTELLIQQLGLCALCGTQLDGPMEPVVDHCHLTGEVRGLLCRNCNTGLGMFEDCLDLLELAAAYLRRSGQT